MVYCKLVGIKFDERNRPLSSGMAPNFFLFLVSKTRRIRILHLYVKERRKMQTQMVGKRNEPKEAN